MSTTKLISSLSKRAAIVWVSVLLVAGCGADGAGPTMSGNTAAAMADADSSVPGSYLALADPVSSQGQQSPVMMADESPVAVRINTSAGTIMLELDPTKAPLTVDNFINYVESGHYDGTIFHRVIDDFMIQGGGFTADYSKKSTLDPVANEADNGASNNEYTIAMARTSDPQSATAQFFINTANNSFLNYRAPTVAEWGYAVFGKVTSGFKVVDSIEASATGAGGPFPTDVPLTTVTINSITVVDGS